ncbi:3-oxoacyl-[acyl-carrier-protein] synthase III C-terminal domain-containing protein [Pseudomonas fluorescens]|uniref:3-oxoacyl-[acyl-carrier-protein] synthase III C-terminal domain-containing protein n=1 Tax=Pseudomonas fluorescens TaxID=294 RepID=UPI00177B2672|nr:3-oxoacyl-[acyl-carrier-protein] synthase III C-terminal domain-containing protein [Pseudomonas fluorescens]
MGLPGQLGCADVGGNTRAGLGALISELASQDQRQRLVVASERRSAKPASAQEMNYGSGAVAMLVGEGDLLATCLGSESLNVPFIDHYRMSGQDYDYYAEERWIRDEGVIKLVPATAATLLERLGISAADLAWFGLSGAPKGSDKLLSRKLGVEAATLLDDFQDEIGDTGTAHSLLQLADALEKAEPGQLILLAAFGQGCDVAVFRKEAGARAPARGVRRALAEGIEETSYMKMLSFEGELNIDWGPRAEVDVKASIAQQYRSHQQILAFTGGKCQHCDSVQFPSLPNCIECGAADSQEPLSLANQRAKVATLSADWLQYYPAPPLYVGLVQFESGARLLMEMVDVGKHELEVGTPLKMVFRIKANDKLRGYRRYFWKATPAV